MKHDDTNSESDGKSGAPTALDPALEARVVAWIAGEASAFDGAELERLIAQQPALAAFKRELETIHGLIGEAARPEKEPLRLSRERRAKLLQVIGADSTAETNAEKSNVVPLPVQPTRRRNRWTWRGPQIYFAASGLAAACLVGVLYLPEAFHGDSFGKGVAVRASHGTEAKSRQIGSPDPIYNVALQAEAAPSLVLSGMLDSGLSKDREMPDKAKADMKRRDADRAVNRKAEVRVQEAPSLARPAPASTIFGGAATTERSKARVATTETISAINMPIVLDAFTVSESRDAGFAAIGSSGRSAAVITPPLMAPPPLAFSESLKKSLASGGGSAGGTVMLSAGVKETDTSRQKMPAAKARRVAESDNKALVIDERATLSGPGAAIDSPKDALDDRPVVRPTPPSDQRAALRNEVTAAAEPESTFSLHVSDVSYRLAQAALGRGERPDPEQIRPEEFYNAFNYGDPVPTMAEKVGARIEQAAHPSLQQRNLVRIAVRVPATGRATGQSLRLTVLLDTSGSMEREDRAATVLRALQELSTLLGPTDRVTLIGFARTPRLLAESVPGDQAAALVDLAARTPAEGGTNLEAALKLGGELARRQQLAGAQNRIVLLTDGAANLGNAEPEQLAEMITGLRAQGIAFDACGIGLDGLDDAVLEALTRRGDGRYHVLNSPADADAGFARKLAGALHPAAENVKLQVRFNAARVGHYRLIGFERHRLRAEDFRNDRVDAAELAAEEAAVAVYQIEVRPEGVGELGDVAVRFRDASTGQMVERTWALPYEASAPGFNRASPSLQLAGVAALLAEKLRGGAPADAISLRELFPVVNALRGAYAHDPRVQEFVTMFTQARQLLRD